MIRCSTCGDGTMIRGHVDNYDVSKLFGMDQPVLLVRAPALVCNRCGAAMLEGEVVEAAEEALARLLAEQGGELRSPEVRFLRGILDMTQAALAERLGTDPATVAHWETGDTSLARLQSLALRSLVAWHLVEKNPKLAIGFSERFMHAPTARRVAPYRLEGIAA